MGDPIRIGLVGAVATAPILYVLLFCDLPIHPLVL